MKAGYNANTDEYQWRNVNEYWQNFEFDRKEVETVPYINSGHKEISFMPRWFFQ